MIVYNHGYLLLRTGLLSRAIVITDESGKVIYTEQVPEIVQDPNYEAALAALS
ncbi:MAG: hypothetical protein OES64_05455 [Desulfobacteraceae bacterium]|nr:hypothetical protein [Desulfobacteraceae bacterium]MDH3722404.1 hypothetical protein [Desulfobacteraceae bacterium]MDH3874767.1 hypothetical protein [Desulfobacteraceae bacterium]MDH3880979.1 hypothetical protein [Desulfobacteraceae bacterium]